MYFGESPYLFGPILLSWRAKIKMTMPQIVEIRAGIKNNGLCTGAKTLVGSGFIEVEAS